MFATLMVLAGSVRCLLRGDSYRPPWDVLSGNDCSSLASRGSLFVMIVLLLSGPDGFESVALLSSAFSPSITASQPVSSLLLGWIVPCASSGPVPIVTSLVPASCAVLVAVLGLVPDADDPGSGVESCFVSSAIFFCDSDSG